MNFGYILFLIVILVNFVSSGTGYLISKRVNAYKVISLCPWCNGYCHRKWTRRHEFKSWTKLIAFHLALIPLGKV